MAINIADLRRLAIGQSLFPETTLEKALANFGFVQADPIRAPARAQDLILRHRVQGYRAGDLERRYTELDIEEDFFINYGFVTRSLYRLMHPRADSTSPRSLLRTGTRRKKVDLLLDFVKQRGVAHPREVDNHFSHGRVTNYWGGSSNASTHLLDAMHYQGLLRVARRESGIRLYSPYEHAPRPNDPELLRQRIDALVDIVVRIYAPLPATSLAMVIRRLRYAAPQWERKFADALKRAKQRLATARVDGVDWYWPTNLEVHPPDDAVRLLAPFDPIVWDRLRFELIWGWGYRFEAYTPPPKRKLGYYALPLLWRDRVIGWGNLSVKDGELRAQIGYVKSAPKDRIFKRELAAELDRVRAFLDLKL